MRRSEPKRWHVPLARADHRRELADGERAARGEGGADGGELGARGARGVGDGGARRHEEPAAEGATHAAGAVGATRARGRSGMPGCGKTPSWVAEERGRAAAARRRRRRRGRRRGGSRAATAASGRTRRRAPSRRSRRRRRGRRGAPSGGSGGRRGLRGRRAAPPRARRGASAAPPREVAVHAPHARVEVEQHQSVPRRRAAHAGDGRRLGVLEVDAPHARLVEVGGRRRRHHLREEALLQLRPPHQLVRVLLVHVDREAGARQPVERLLHVRDRAAGARLLRHRVEAAVLDQQQRVDAVRLVEVADAHEQHLVGVAPLLVLHPPRERAGVVAARRVHVAERVLRRERTHELRRRRHVEPAQPLLPHLADLLERVHVRLLRRRQRHGPEGAQRHELRGGVAAEGERREGAGSSN